MNLKEIKEMIALMNEHSLSELELEKDGLRIRLRKGPLGIAQEVVISQPAAAAAPKAGLPAAEAPEAEIKAAQIKAPMVGTFYRAPSPDAPPYVDAGQVIEVGQVVCIIEAMKLMNEIKSEIRAKVLEVLVENGQPVEFGQPLFLVEEMK